MSAAWSAPVGWSALVGAAAPAEWSVSAGASVSAAWSARAASAPAERAAQAGASAPAAARAAAEGRSTRSNLAGFGTTEFPGLNIANETLAFPLALGQVEQALSPSNPGDLVVVYTRAGCSADAEGLAADALLPRRVPAEPVALTSVTIDQFVGVGVTASPQILAEKTCLTLRSLEGTWTALLQPETITPLSDDAVRAEFVIDGLVAESAAIFLPTYTYVSKISYRVATP